jgi:two-component system, NarL family, sensor histidine kinase UhpB
MPGSLRLLLLEDDEGDAALVLWELRNGGFHLAQERVDTIEAFKRALSEQSWDIIIADYNLPTCNALDALAALTASGLDIPLLLISGSIGEEAAAGAIRAGAADYLDKHNLTRLPAIVARELRDAERRRQNRLVAQQRREIDERFRLAIDLAQLGTFDWDLVKDHIEADERLLHILGLPAGTPIGSYADAMQHIHPEDLPRMQQWTANLQEGTKYTRQYRIVRPDGTFRWVASRTHIENDTAGRQVRLLGVLQDIHDLKSAEQELVAGSQRLQHLSRQLLAAQETERRHIARELHDEIGQGLTAAIISLQIALQDPQSAALAPDLEEALKLLETTLQQVRTMSVDLRPAILDDLGLASALQWYVDRVARRAGFKTHLVTQALPWRLPAELATVCFRVIQEALTNVVRHARASHVDVVVQCNGRDLALSVSDDGIGFDTAAAQQRVQGGGSLGMLSMEERVTLAGGTFQVDAAPGRGTRISARLPLACPGPSSALSAEETRT